tara:strand:+ start:1393 stop:1980 length:588 start_codon:yes stop_codon:yes gene_type:complete
MIKVGITGGIGVGKTYICNILKKMGYSIFSSDQVSKKLVYENTFVRDQIKFFFGEDIIENEKINRKKLATQVFSNKKKLKKLNEIIHPFVKKEFDKWMSNRYDEKVVFKEAAILFEANSQKNLDYVVCVSAKLQDRINRVMQRDKVDSDSVEKRISMQMPQNEKEKLSDFVIFNSKDDLVLPQIIKVLEKIFDLK